MKIDFIVGEIEQHQMELCFDQISGDLIISMDGIQVLQDSPLLASEPEKSYELNIGEAEKHRLALQLIQEEATSDPAPQAFTRLIVTAMPA